MAKHLTKEERLTKRLKNNWVIAVASVAIGGLVVLGNAAGAFKDLKEALLGKAETRSEGPVIRFAAQDGAGCLPLPANARVTVSAAGAAPQQATVNGCEARLPWAIDWRTGRSATIEVAGASGFERAEPSESYRLGDGEWTVKMRFKPGAPRIVVRVFDYATTDAALDQQLDQFHTIVRTKIRILAESLAARDPEYRYVADLTVEPMRRELTASASAALAEWRNSGALMFLSGLFFRRDTESIVRSHPFFGELAAKPDVGPVQLDLPINPEEFSTTIDSHSLAVLYALAMDARRRGQPDPVVLTFLGEAVSVAQGLDAQLAGVGRLKAALRGLFKELGAPVPEVL